MWTYFFVFQYLLMILSYLDLPEFSVSHNILVQPSNLVLHFIPIDVLWTLSECVYFCGVILCS